MRVAALVGLSLGLSVAGSAGAQPVAPDYSPDEFVKAILAGPKPCPKDTSLAKCEANPKTRRFTLAEPLSNAPPKRQASRAKAEPNAPRLMRMTTDRPKVTAADVLVTFAKGSAEITPQGQANLRSIATGLNKAALAEVDFEVAGFTDVSGPYALNRALSLARAEAVKTYLTALNVNPKRLTAVGYGPEHLIDPSDPTSEANRRVELHRQN
jgi:outer membrane protein OmpA-like peptidoglycan-associated protein